MIIDRRIAFERTQPVVSFVPIPLLRKKTHLVTGSITVIRTTESGDTQSIMFNRIPILPYFMRSNNGSDFVEFTPSFRDVWTKS